MAGNLFTTTIFGSALGSVGGSLGGGLAQSVFGQGQPQTATEAQMMAERQMMVQQSQQLFSHRTYAQGIQLTREAVQDTQERLTASIFNNAFTSEVSSSPLFLKRKWFLKPYSKESFNDMTSEPVIKDILPGSYKLNKEQVKERIKEHMAVLV